MSDWTDDDGNALGEWVDLDLGQWRATVEAAGGLEALTVFETLTDPDGVYGARQIYTAWGHRGADVPLVDLRDYKADDGTTERRVCRRFALADALSEKEN